MKRVLIGVLVLGVLLAGCESKPTVEKKVDNSKPVVQENLDNNVIKTKTVTVYFSDGIESLVGEQRNITYKNGESLEKKVVEELVKGSTVSGHKAILPNSTKINSVKVDNGIAVVDLSSEFLTGLNGGSEDENLRIYSIVDTLTGLENIKKVQFLINGQKRKILGETELDGDYERDATVIKK